jgi:catechol 2,3-dioxygenase-like lactoylglutathione lyase family enzyme
MIVKAGWSTPMLHVNSVEESIKFYERLGFELIDTDRCKPIGWARIHCEGGAMMFLRAEDDDRVDPTNQGVMFYMYTPDLPAFREKLVADGVEVSEIKRPPYMPSGEVYLKDPDGFVVGVGHWSDKEHAEWLKRIGRTSV